MRYDNNNFVDVLLDFVARDGRRARQLAKASAGRFGSHQELSHVTISRWLRGEVKRPRAWQDLVKLAIVLRLSESEADKLLISASHRPIVRLREMASRAWDRKLLSHWDKRERQADQAPPPFQVPPDVSDFTGRKAKLEELKEAGRHQGAILCLQGMGGVGKTTLAIHLAYQLRPHFPDGVLWAQLEQPNSNALSVLRSFAASYGQDVSQYSDLGSRSSKVRELLAYKRALIVLDDAQCDKDVRPLLPSTGLCTVIITTRRHDLSVATHPFEIGPLQKEDGLALFAKILGAELAQKEPRALSEMADLLGHLPLAIAIAANRMKYEPNWSATSFLARIRKQERRLTELVRGDQHVRLSFDLSYQELPAHLPPFFAALGLFEGEDFSPDAAAYVAALPTEEAEDHLRHLYRLSLVQQGRADRYKLHPLLRDYSREQISGPREELRIANCGLRNRRSPKSEILDSFIPKSEIRNPKFLTPHQPGAGEAELSERMVSFFVDYVEVHESDYATLDLDVGNLFAALQVAFERDMKAALLRGAIAFYPFLQARGLYAQAKLYSERAHQAAKELGDQVGLAKVLRNLGRIANKQGHYSQAEELYQKALILARQTENNEQISALLTSLGALCHRRGNFAQAKEHYAEAMSLAKQVKNTSRMASLLTNLGLVAAEEGQYEEAQSYYQDALQQARQVGNKRRLITTLRQNLGQLMQYRGDYAQAKAHFTEGLALAREIGDPELRSRLLGNLGLTLCALGNHAEAAAHFRTGLSLAEKSGLSLQISRQKANLAKVETYRRNYEQANWHYKDALALARQNSFPADICAILNQWGDCYRAQEKWAEAADAFREALQIARQANIQREIAKSLEGLARLAAKRGNISEARQLGQESQAIFATIGHKRASEVSWWLKELPGVVDSSHLTLP